MAGGHRAVASRRVAGLEIAGRKHGRFSPVIKAMQYRFEQLVNRWLGLAALSVALAGMYLPVLMVFIYSFNASRIGTVWTGFSFRGYRDLFEQPELWLDDIRAFFRTVR